MALDIRVRHYTKIYGGKELKVKETKIYGLHTYIDNGKPITADWATFTYYGPRLGATRCYTRHREVPPTPEETATGRAHLMSVLEQCMREQGLH